MGSCLGICSYSDLRKRVLVTDFRKHEDVFKASSKEVQLSSLGFELDSKFM